MEAQIEIKNEITYKPFLKWAGGKTQLLPELKKYIPLKFDRYIEPFIGGGAMFFYIQPTNAIISDSNEDLVITYNAVKDNVDLLIKDLKSHINNEEYYYKIRAINPISLDNIKRASRFIFLNKTCFNGLYRVNKQNGFNVPYGKRKNPNICDIKTLKYCSQALRNTLIIHGDYLDVLKEHARPNDFIFIDPPYVPIRTLIKDKNKITNFQEMVQYHPHNAFTYTR